MAACAVEIVLDRSGEAPDWHPVYAMGDTLSGSVNVDVSAPVQCEGLDIELLYVRRDHHQGTPMEIGFGELDPEHHTRASRVRLFSGRWEAGQHAYPFSMPVPSPASYDGQLSSWSWLAYARAHIPFATDASGRAAFRVEVPAATRRRYTPLPAVRSGGESTLLANAPGLVIAPLLGMGAGWLIGPAAGLNALGPALAGALLGLLVAVLVVQRARAKASVIGPELDVAVIHAGVQQVLRCRAVAGAGAPVEHVYIALAVRESTTRRAHSGSRTFDRPMHKELWRQETRLACTADDVYTCDLPLPEPDALPFSTGRDALGRGVIWEITARVVRESNGDSSEHTGCEIDVQPELVP